MSSLRTQTVSADEFQDQLDKHPNPVITADYRWQYVTVGSREYRTELVTR